MVRNMASMQLQEWRSNASMLSIFTFMEGSAMAAQMDAVINALTAAKRVTKSGGEYWMARDIQEILGYQRWENFENIIGKARQSCESAGNDPLNHFRESTKMVEIGSTARVKTTDYFLSRYAAYVVAMNGDSSKPEIATAQAYFAMQTTRQEINDQISGVDKRIELRDRVRLANKDLASAAKQSGVVRYGVFQAAGYQGLYEMGLAEIKKAKGIGKTEDLLDRVGRAELAANEFRITQTEQKLTRDRTNTEREAIQTHLDVGREVRTTIRKLGGTLPEKLPAEPSLKKLVTKSKKQIN